MGISTRFLFTFGYLRAVRSLTVSLFTISRLMLGFYFGLFLVTLIREV